MHPSLKHTKCQNVQLKYLYVLAFCVFDGRVHLLVKRFLICSVYFEICVWFLVEEGSKTKRSSFELKVLTILPIIFFPSFCLYLLFICSFTYLFFPFFFLFSNPNFLNVSVMESETGDRFYDNIMKVYIIILR